MVILSPSANLYGIDPSTSSLNISFKRLVRKFTCKGLFSYSFSCVPLVDFMSMRNTPPFLNSIYGDENYETIKKKNGPTLACVVEISLSLYRETPFSLNKRPVDLPILNSSSPFS